MDQQELASVVDQIVQTCRSKVPPAIEVRPESSLTRDLGLDSLQALELVSEVETAFQVRIPSEMLPEVDTIRDVGALVLRVKNGCPN